MNDELLERLKKDLVFIEIMIDSYHEMVMSMQMLDSHGLDREDAPYINSTAKMIEEFGEQTKSDKLSSETKEEYDQIDWSQINRMKNKFTHNYQGIDVEMMYEIADVDMKRDVEILEDIRRDMLSRIEEIESRM